MYAKNWANALTLKNCFHVPNDVGNLIPISWFIHAGGEIQIKWDSMEFCIPNNKILSTASLQGMQFILNIHAAMQMPLQGENPFQKAKTGSNGTDHLCQDWLQ